MKVVNHKDHNKSNNCIENLEWLTQKQNIQYTYKEKGKRSQENKYKKVKCLRTSVVFSSVLEAALANNCSKATIVYRCKKGESMQYLQDQNLDNEIWKKHQHLDVVVSSMGRYITRYGKKTFGYKSPTGYCTMKVDGKSFLVHRLIAETFIETRNVNLQVNHKDLDGYNNKVSNLEWMTQSENIKHSYKKNKFRKKYVICDQNNLPNEFWKKHKFLPIKVSNKGRILNGRGVKSYGSLDAGYRRIKIQGKTYRVHILVAETFL